MDIWDWVHDSVRGDDAASRARRVLYLERQHASRLCQRDPRGAIAMLECAIARARQLNEPWWELFLEHWRLQFLLTRARDPKTALPIAARCALEARKPLYDAFPQRVCLHEDLITAYVETDPIGNAELIENALDYMDGEIAPGTDCRMCHAGLRAEFALATGDAEALDVAHAYLAMSETGAGETSRDYFRAYALLALCRALWHAKPDEAATQLEPLSEAAQEHARLGGAQEALPELMMWQALGAQLGGRNIALQLFRQAHATRERSGSAPAAGYCVAALGVLEHRGDLRGALELIEAELDEIAGTGQAHREVLRRLRKCALLRATGANASDEIARVRALMGELKNADWVKRELAQLR